MLADIQEVLQLSSRIASSTSGQCCPSWMPPKLHVNLQLQLLWVRSHYCLSTSLHFPLYQDTDGNAHPTVESLS